MVILASGSGDPQRKAPQLKNPQEGLAIKPLQETLYQTEVLRYAASLYELKLGRLGAKLRRLTL